VVDRCSVGHDDILEPVGVRRIRRMRLGVGSPEFTD
jgi:hypothetical protein